MGRKKRWIRISNEHKKSSNDHHIAYTAGYPFSITKGVSRGQDIKVRSEDWEKKKKKKEGEGAGKKGEKGSPRRLNERPIQS